MEPVLERYCNAGRRELYPAMGKFENRPSPAQLITHFSAQLDIAATLLNSKHMFCRSAISYSSLPDLTAAISLPRAEGNKQ